jgi:transcriptional regulator with XRE-family HTH domain
MEDSIIQRVREVLVTNALNMSQFANCIKCEQKTVHNYLNGKRKLSLEFVESTIRTFGLDANWLLFGTGSYKQEFKPEDLSSSNDLIDYREKWIELLQENIELLRKIADMKEAEASLENSKGGAVAIARAANMG